MAQKLVTLEHPDGRRHRTDNPSEVNMLVGTYGYRRVEEETSQSGRSSKHQRSARSSATSDADASQSSPNVPSTGSDTPNA